MDTVAAMDTQAFLFDLPSFLLGTMAMCLVVLLHSFLTSLIKG
jgi:hypothetical protein